MSLQPGKIKIVVLAITTLLLTILVQRVLAQSLCPSNTRACNGLVTTPNSPPTSVFNTNLGTYIENVPQAALPTFELQSYDDLKTIYFNKNKNLDIEKITVSDTSSADQGIFARATTTPTQGSSFYLKNASLAINEPITGVPGFKDNRSYIVFIDGDLNIRSDLNYAIDTAHPNRSLSLVVKGNVNIDSSVHHVDAAIFAEGRNPGGFSYSICTVSVANSCSDRGLAPADLNPLVINGSLVALNANYPIIFRRNLVNNTTAAEQINTQPKYLVLLKELFSQTLNITTFGTNYGPPRHF